MKNSTTEDLSLPNQSFNHARLQLLLKFTFSLSVLILLLFLAYIFSDDYSNLIIFSLAFLLTVTTHLYLRKTKNHQPIYYLICICGILFPLYTLNNTLTLIHFGDFIWLMVAVALAFFGLGNTVGFIFLILAWIDIIYYILVSMNTNLAWLPPQTFEDKISLIVEMTVASFTLFYIISRYTKLHFDSEKKIIASNEILLEQNNIINEQKNEIELLLHEVHHRVKNNLQIMSSLLSIQAQYIDEPKAVNSLQEAQARLEAMSKLHHLLYQHGENKIKTNFKNYLHETISAFENTFGQKNVSIDFRYELAETEIDFEKIIPLGLIINELCTNALKHGIKNNNSIFISLSPTNENKLLLIIKDSGLGLPESFEKSKEKSFGLKLVDLLTQQLNGHIEYKNEGGAFYRIII